MKLNDRLKKCLILLILISFFPFSVSATDGSDGKYSRVQEGQSSPFTGWCFDDLAWASLMARVEYSEQRCNLRIDKSLALLKAETDLVLKNLQLRLEASTAQFETELEIKNTEIEELETAALKRPNDHGHWWAAGGFVLGVITTTLIIYAVTPPISN